jgi:hypothetical protein
MAEKAKEQKRRREIKDAGQRTVVQGIELKADQVAQALAKATGIKVEGKNQEEIRKNLKPFFDRLGVSPEESVMVWVPVGQVQAETREAAVDSAVGEDTPGEFRAPNASAWRGRVVRRIPERVPLDVQIADD